MHHGRLAHFVPAFAISTVFGNRLNKCMQCTGQLSYHTSVSLPLVGQFISVLSNAMILLIIQVGGKFRHEMHLQTSWFGIF